MPVNNFPPNSDGLLDARIGSVAADDGLKGRFRAKFGGVKGARLGRVNLGDKSIGAVLVFGSQCPSLKGGVS